MRALRMFVGSLAMVLVLAGCVTQGPPGPAGPEGPGGPQGPEGPAGTDGNANVSVLSLPNADVTWASGTYVGRTSNVFTFDALDIDAALIDGGAVLGFVLFDGNWLPLPITWENSAGTTRQYITFTYALESITLYAYDTDGAISPTATEYRFLLIREPELLTAAARAGYVDLTDLDAVVRHLGLEP
jgi:hypothetical protein